MTCGRKRCSVTWGEVKDFDNDVTIESIKKTMLKLKTKQPVAGSEQNVPPDKIDEEVKKKLKEELKLFIYDSEDCNPGCWCYLNGPVTSGSKTMDIEIEFEYREKKEVWRKAEPNETTNGVADKILSGDLTATDLKTGQPFKFNPEVDEGGDVTGSCCGGASTYVSVYIFNVFHYKIKVKAKVELTKQLGDCKPLEEWPTTPEGVGY